MKLSIRLTAKGCEDSQTAEDVLWSTVGCNCEQVALQYSRKQCKKYFEKELPPLPLRAKRSIVLDLYRKT